MKIAQQSKNPITDALVEALKARTTSKDYYTLCCELEQSNARLLAAIKSLSSAERKAHARRPTMTTADTQDVVTPADSRNGEAGRLCVQRLVRPSVLDLFCGVGGWSKSFAARGWSCVGVDIASLGYPYELVQCSVLDLTPAFLDSFDAIVASPPCEEFARAWLPWLRGDHKPEQWAIDLLEWSVKLCEGRKNRIVECSNFSARHVPGGTRFESYTLWGDVPLLMPQLPRGKMAKSGMKPELRAEIPPGLADWIADNYTRAYRSNSLHERPGAKT